MLVIWGTTPGDPGIYLPGHALLECLHQARFTDPCFATEQHHLPPSGDRMSPRSTPVPMPLPSSESCDSAAAEKLLRNSLGIAQGLLKTSRRAYCDRLLTINLTSRQASSGGGVYRSATRETMPGCCTARWRENRGQSRMALPGSHAAVAKRARACCRGTLRRGYGFGRRLHARGS